MMNNRPGRHVERTASTPTTSDDQGGYALAVSLIAIVVVTMLAAAGFNLSNMELDTSRDYRAQTEAFYLADKGLNQYLATHAADLDTAVTYQFDEGTATVTPVRLSMGMANNEELYRAVSTGEYVTSDGRTIRKTVSTVLLATPLLPNNPTSPFVSGGKLRQNGNADFDGNNEYPSTSGTDALCQEAGVQEDGSVPGIVADSFQNSNGDSGRCTDPKKGNVTPDPPGVECRDDPVDEFMSYEQWQYILGMEADHQISSGDPFPQTDGYEVVKVNGDYTRDSGSRTGEGVLIVEGDFKSDGNFTWDGLVLVGGKYTANGNETIHGSIITGLNGLDGSNVPTTAIGNGTKDFQYNSCNVFKASRSKFRVSKVPSTWYENQ